MRLTATVMMALATATPALAQFNATSVPTPIAALPGPVGGMITLPAQTEIWLSPAAEVSSKSVRQGDIFAMKVSRDVFLGDVLVVPRGTGATARIGLRSGKGALGKSAKLEFDVVSLDLAHHPVAASGHYRVAGAGNGAVAVPVFVLVSMVGGLLITGHSAVILPGSEWRATTAEATQIDLNGTELMLRSAELNRRIAPASRVAMTPRADTLAPASAASLPNTVPVVPSPVVRVVASAAPVTLARDSFSAVDPVRRPASSNDYPPNSAYLPEPAEIFVRTLPPRP